MITFYDISSNLPGRAWSPNTFKTRISLNYKGIKYKTEWVELPNIESTMKKLGGAPTAKKDDGTDFYTLPAIHDSETGKVITDSVNVAKYLDEKYPDKPLLFLPGTDAAIAMLEDVLVQAISKPIPMLVLPTNNIFNPTTQECFRTVREKRFGKKLEELVPPPGPARSALWDDAKSKLEKLGEFYDKNENGHGEEKLFFFGDMFSFGDAIVIGYLLWIKLILGADNEEWKEVASWSNGRWGKLVESTKVLQAID